VPKSAVSYVVWVPPVAGTDTTSRIDATLVSASFRPCTRPSFLPSSKIEALPFSRVLAIVPFTNSYVAPVLVP
jgi:hypothetical protein